MHSRLRWGKVALHGGGRAGKGLEFPFPVHGPTLGARACRASAGLDCLLVLVRNAIVACGGGEHGTAGRWTQAEQRPRACLQQRGYGAHRCGLCD